MLFSQANAVANFRIGHVWHHMDISGLGVSYSESLLWVYTIVICLVRLHPQIFLVFSAGMF